MSGLISTAGYGSAEKVYATIQSHCFWSLSYHLDWHINHVLGLIMWPFAAACGLGFEAKKALEGYRLLAYLRALMGGGCDFNSAGLDR
jgi:hypothetical protein